MSDLSKYSDEEILGILTSDTETELKKRGYEYGWHKKETRVGAIYVLVNPAFPELVKIGYADDVQKRLKTLNSNSGLPDPFHCYAIYKVKKRLEDLRLHNLIDTLDPTLRHSKNREFYEMNCEKAFDILSAIAQINGDEEQLSINPFFDSFFQKKEAQDEDGAANAKSSSARLRFSMLGIPVGSTLVFTKDTSVTCVTKDDVNQVEYKGETYSLSALAKLLLNTVAAQGGKYFMYNGEALTSMRQRLGV